MLSIIAKSLKTGVLTETRSSEAPPSFGFPVIDFSRCVACDECARSCPTGAIKTAVPGPGRPSGIFEGTSVNQKNVEPSPFPIKCNTHSYFRQII